MSARNALSRLFSERRCAPTSGSTPAAPRTPVPSRRTALFEALESRLLLSADLAPQTETLLSQGLTQFATWAQGAETVAELAKGLPGFNTTIGQAVDLPGTLQSRLVTPVLDYLNQAGTQTTDGLVAALEAVLGAGTVTGDRYGDEIRFDVVLDAQRVLADQPFAVPASANGLALTADANGKLDLTAAVRLDFSFGVDLADGLAPEERFFVSFDDFKASVTADAALDFGLALGFLDATVTGGTFKLNAFLDIDVLNPDADAAGHITLSELLGTTIEGMVDPTVTTGTIVGRLPISVAALGSFNAGAAEVRIDAANLFDAPPVVTVTGATAPDITNFGRVQPEAVLQVLNQVGSWLNGLRTSDAFTGVIPLADGRTFGEVLQFAESFTSGLIDQLKNAEGVATFATAQSFATRLSEVLGLPPEAINAAYNAANDQLTFFLRLQSGFAASSDTLDFNFNVAPLGGISTASTLSIDANGAVQFVLGFDLTPYSAVIVGDDVLPLNGVLTANAAFKISAAGGAYVDVVVARDATNTTRAGLIADINAAMTAAGVVGVTASLDANRLRFTHAGGFTGAFLNVLVPDVATNTAATELKLKAVNTAVDSLTRKAFLRDVRATGNVTATASDIDATANVGFFGVGIENGNATVAAQVDVQFRKGNNNATPMRFSDLFEGIDNIPAWTNITSTGTLNAALPIAVTSGLIALPGTPRVVVAMTNIFQPNTLSVTTPDLAPLLNYKELDFADVLGAFGSLVTYLSTIDQFSFIGLDLPLIDRSVADLVSLAGKFGDAKATLESAGVQTIQQLEQRIEQAFGIAPSALTLSFAAQSLEFDLDLGRTYSEDLALDLDLGQLAGFTNTDGTNLNGVGDLIDVGGSAKLDVDAAATLNLIFGFDLTNPASPRAYIRDDSNLALTAKVAGSDMDFSAAVGPLGVFVRDGSVRLDNGAGIPASFTVGFKPVAGDRYYVNQWNTSALDVALAGSASATLPLYFPTVTNPVGGAGNNNLQLSIGNLANIAGTTTISAPNLAAEIGSIDLFSNMNSFVDGIDLILATIQDALDGQVFGVNLPFVGDNLKDGAQFIETLRTEIVQRLDLALSGGTQSADQVRQILLDALGPAGLDVLLDQASNGIGIEDVILDRVDSNNDGKYDDVKFRLKLGAEYDVTAPIGFDIGLPGLGLAVADNSNVNLKVGFSFDLGVGVSRTDGAYIDTSVLNEVAVQVEATLGDFAMGGTLGVLRLRIQDETDDADGQNPSLFTAGFAVDLRDPVGGGNRLTFNELAGGSLGFGQIVSSAIDPSFTSRADINLDLTLGVPGDFSVTDPNASDFLSEQFPTMTADFNLTWVFSPATGLSGSLQNVSFDNVRLNFGEFLGNFLSPIVDNITGIFDPLKPIIDAVTEPLPIISDLAGQDYSLLDLATDFGFIPQSTHDFVQALDDILEFADAISATAGDGVFIDFGSFNLNGIDLRNPATNAQLKGANVLNGKTSAPSTTIASQLDSVADDFKTAKDKIKANDSGGFRIPLLEDPLSAFKLILGQNVDLLTYTTPKFEFGFDFEMQFGPIAVVLGVPIYVIFGGGASLEGQFTFGYDTQGIFDFADSGNAVDLFNGFFIADHDASGKDIDEMVLRSQIYAGAKADIFLAEIGAKGGVFADVFMNINDPNDDGKLRGKELFQVIQNGFLCAFDYRGELGLFLSVFAEIGPSPFSVTFEFEIARITLISFEVDCDEPPPVLATLDETTGVLSLNMGPRSTNRLHGNTADGNESFSVKQIGQGTVMVEAFGYSQLYGRFSNLDEENGTLGPDVTRIKGWGGAGADQISIDDSVDMPVELWGDFETADPMRDGNDLLIAGGDGVAVLQGGGGADQLFGGKGNDIIYGHLASGAGDDNAADVIYGRGGDDTIFGQGGADRIDGEAGNDTIDGGAGADVIYGSTGDDTLRGGAGADQIYGQWGADILEGGAGTDALVGGADNDVLYGFSTSGSGDDGTRDLLWGDFATGTDYERVGEEGASGNDTLVGQGGGDDLYGEAGDDRLFGGSGNDNLFGGAGRDTIYGETGADFISGGTEADEIRGGADNDEIHGDQANDLIYGDAGDDTILGGGGDDTILAGSGNDIVRGQEGNDQIFGEEGNDQLSGDLGDDVIVGGLDDDLAWGGAGNDRIYGSEGNDELFGGAGEDAIYGETGDDLLWGNAGDDLLDGGSGLDVLRGGFGNDLLIAGIGVGKRLYGDEGDDRILGSDDGGEDGNFLDDVFFGDRIFGGDGNDWIRGLGGADIIDGGAGDDDIDGGVHGDYVLGGTGRDRIAGSFGNDRLFGGADDDTIDGGFGTDHVRGEDGNDELIGGGGVGDDLGGGDGEDILRGSDNGADVMAGDAGRDLLFGNGGNDVLRGGDGDDIIEGGAGDDLIEGNAGVDVLLGGAQHDRLYGHSVSGAGDDNAVDWLYGDFGTDLGEAGSGRDQLFGQGGNDILFGEGEDDSIDAGAGTSNIVNLGVGDPAGFAAPIATAAPLTIVSVVDPGATPTLPSGPDYRGWWGEFSGSASGNGVSGGGGIAVESSVAVTTTSRIMAWADTRNGSFEIYVARNAGGEWSELGSSASGGGVSSTLSQSRRPSVVLSGGAPVVAWTEIAASGASNIRVAQWNGAAWVALGESLDGDGISNSNAADNVQLLATDSGLVAVWTDRGSGTPQVHARRFDGANWVPLGGSVAVTAVAGGVREVAATTNGARIGIAWSQGNGDSAEVFAREFVGGSWTAAANVSANIGPSRTPTVAYLDNVLFAAWQDQTAGREEIYARQLIGGSWVNAGVLSSSGGGVSMTTGRAFSPKLASGGGELWLTWADDSVQMRPDNTVSFYVKQWTVLGFGERMPGDASSRGVSPTSGNVQGFTTAVDSAGRPYIAWTDASTGSPRVHLRGNLQAASNVYTATGATTVQNILDNNDLGAGDVIYLAPGNHAGFTLGANDSGVLVIGSPQMDSVVVGNVVVTGGAGGVLQRLSLSNGVVLDGAVGLTVHDSAFTNENLVVNGGSDLQIVHNRFGGGSGVRIGAAAAGVIAHNEISGSSLVIDAAFTGGIRDNDIFGANVGVRYNAGAALIGNRIRGNSTGIVSTVSGNAALGWVGSEANEIAGNTTGVFLMDARVRGQHITGNQIGVSGSGVVGGGEFDTANRIEANVVGVGAFDGTVQFNRIVANTTGVAASNGQRIVHNLIYRNTGTGIQVSGDSDVRIGNNTLYSPVGDLIRISGGSSNVDVRNNVLWNESGYGIHVANDSQRGFFSDYNNLYSSGTGRIGYWTRDFDDILDWQADIARFDLHSIGRTDVNPQWAEPRFVNRGQDDYRLMPVTAGLRFTSPGIDDGDARADLGVPPGYTNLLSNPGFESDLAGWDQFNINGTVVTTAPGAHSGAKFFRPGTIEEGYIEQVVDLVGPEVSAAQIDGQDLELVFGGRIRAAVETPRDRGAIEIRFLDATNAVMGTPVRVDATSTTDRWELVGGRIDIPTGARKAVYRFIADREQASGTADAYLDGAFVQVRTEAQGTDLGAYGHTTADVARTGAPRISLRYPDLYADLEKDKPLTLRWETFGNSSESPVRIELWQDGLHGPALRQTIAAATADDGEHIWIPSSSGLDFGTYGLRIQVSLVNVPIAIDRSQETFTVPEAGTTYWVDDASNVDDEYTPGGIGDNRHTGKLATAPKPYATNLLRVYELNAASVLNIDTGEYSMIDPVNLSGTTDLGLGLDEGFTVRGPVDVSRIAGLFPAIPGDRTQPVILLDDADNMTISGLTLRNALRGLEVRNGSDGLALSYITVTGHAQDGMRVDTNAPFSTFRNLTAHGNTGRGIWIDGPIAGFTHGLAYSNTGDGIVIDGAIGVVSDSLVRDNGGVGLIVSGPGAGSRVEANVAYRNNVGLQVYSSAGGAEAIVGHMDLSLGRGNHVYENRQIGIQAAYNTRVAGNTIQNQTNQFATGLSLFAGGSASRNVVSGNYDGISLSGGGDLTDNRVYDNDRFGITGSGVIDRNVVYSNATNINVGGGSVLRNNLLYASVDYGVFLSGSSAQIVGNTVHATSGDAIRIQGNASNVRVRNNILWATVGDALSVAADSQSGFASDFNLFQATGSGAVGLWQGVERGSLVSWQNATFGDRNSLFGDPLFVDIDGADGVLGYGGVGSDGRDDDFHERSQFGSFKGGALAPVRDATTGLPVFLTPVLSLDAVTGPGIDRGAPTDPFGNEPANDGGYVNIGAYGNTAQASRSPAQYMLVTNPNGGEAIPQESTYEIRWRSNGFGGNVAIEISAVAGAPVWQLLADNEVNDGSHLWSVDPVLFAVGDAYRIRVRSIDTPSILDASNAAFSITPPISVFYVNDGSTAGDQYSTAIGNDANDGLTPATPKATIRGVLEAYDLDAGDVIRVDTGYYLLTANIELVTQDSGVTIEGPTLDGLAAVLDRGNTSTTSFVFNLLGADDVTLRNLVIRGGHHGIVAGTNAGSDRLTVERSELIRNSQHGIFIGDGNTNALISDNEIYSNGSWGLNLNGAGTRAVGNHVWSNGGGITASYNGAAARIDIIGNTVHDNGTGIAVSYWVLVEGNRVYGNSGTGMNLYDDRSLASNNEIYRNATGLLLSVGGVGRDNRVYANSGTGIELGGSGGGIAEGNVVYGNSIGITEGASRVAGNLVYDNTVAGIVTSGYRGAGDGIIGNTVVQPTGDAIRVAGGAQNVLIRDNIIEAGSGIAINVPSNAQDRFDSDYNLFRLGEGARISYWEDRPFFTLADWFYETGRDGESLVADPLFIDPAGADGTRGYSAALVGVPRLVDDGDAGFTIVGPWELRIGRNNEVGPPAYTATALERTIFTTATGNDIHWIPGGGDGSSVARWSFDGLEDGTYQIAARWPNGAGLSLTTGSYRVYDGSTTVADVVAVASLSQNVPNDFADADGLAWERLETVEIRNGRLIVELSNVGGSTSSRIMADAVRIQRILGDQGADDDIRLATRSPAVDRGDPTSRFEREPISNGGRVDLGAYGNTPDATQSPAQMVQVVNPNGLEKMEIGQSVSIDYRSAGLTLTDTLLLMNSGSGTASGFWVAQSDVAGIGTPVRSYVIPGTTPITTAGVVEAAPDDVYRTIAYADAGVGKTLRYEWQVDDGDYEVVLHFIDPTVNTVGQRTFDIALQGVVVRADLDVRAVTGGINRAMALRFDATAAGGQGLRLDLINKVSSAMISGIEIRRANAGGVAAPTVDLDVSVDGGVTWIGIAEDLPVDRFGRGSYTWAAGPQVGNALIRATAHAGAVTVTDVSDRPFQIANAGTAYYVNDGSTAGDEFTTAVGDNANDGKTAATPMASLAALLRAYDLDAGDVIHVDTGVYSLATNILLESQDSGVTIRGPQLAGNLAVLNRGNTGESVIQFAGADDVTLERVVLTGGQYGVRGNENVDSDRITLDDVIVHGNTFGVTVGANNENFTIRDSEVYGNSSSGISVTTARGRVENNLVRNNSTGISVSAPGGEYTQGVFVVGNEVRNNSTGISASNRVTIEANIVHHNSANGINADQSPMVRGNTVYSNSGGGISVTNNASAIDNRVFDNAGTGIYVRSGLAAGNVVYANATGMENGSNSTVTGNLIYENRVRGVLMNGFNSAGDGLFGNTIHQSAGDGVLATGGGSNTSIRNNIIVVGAGYALRVGNNNQIGFASDYNLFHTFGTGKLAFWEGRDFLTLADWSYETANDLESAIANPAFVDIDGADGMLGFVGGVDGGLDDDFRLSVGSPGVDAGDPTSIFVAEPESNGGRVDLGVYGNTARATQSAPRMVQVLNPNGLEKFEAGQTVQVEVRSAGLTPYDTVLRINNGGATAPVDGWSVDRYREGGSTRSTATAISTDGVVGAASPAIYQTSSNANFGLGNKLVYRLPAPDGDYRLVLHTASDTSPIGAARFGISVDGVEIAASVDRRAIAGAANKAVVLAYDVTASGGDGLVVELTNLTNNEAAVISGIELQRINPAGVANPTVDLEVSTDGGSSWIPIAGGVALDRFGRGSFAWNAGPVAASALIRATGHAGAVTVTDVSNAPFQIANAGTAYYVNDGSLVGNEYTTSAGNNANDGKTAATPMASLAALLRAYDLDPGDVIHVDTGVYNLATNIVLTAQDSGVTIRGPVLPTHDAVLNRGNTTTDQRVFSFEGASNVTLEWLNVTGGQHGIEAVGTAGNDSVLLRFMDIYGNASHGVQISNGHSDWVIRDSTIHNNLQHGVSSGGAERVRIENNEVYGNNNRGISVSGGTEATRSLVIGNDVHDNGSVGIDISSHVTARGNRVYNHNGPGDIGIYSYNSSSLIIDNDAYDNTIGIQTGFQGSIVGNRSFDNGTGIITYYSSNISRNYVHSNSTGIHDAGYSEVFGNLVYANTNVGISTTFTHSAGDRTIYNNTVWQGTGDAIRVTGTNNVRIRNNILSVGNGYAINVTADGQPGFSSDWNLFDLRTAAALVGRWGATQRETLGSWRSVSANHDASGKTGDPMFLDIDGADNVLGDQDVTTGNGYDDNFSLDAGSAAIDAGNAYEAAKPVPNYPHDAALRDIEDRQRHDDPSTVNTGVGWDLFVESTTGGSSYVETGTAVPLRSTNSVAMIALPFSFEFYGRTYTSVQASVNGYLHFGGLDGATVSDANSLDLLLRNVRIAPLWDNLRTDTTQSAASGATVGNVFVDSTVADQVTVRWAATRQETGGGDVNFSVTLFANGNIRFDYGDGNKSLTPTVGLSAGNGFTFVTSAYNGADSLENAPSVLFTRTPGLTYFDIGAYEFLGNSGDAVAPTVEAVSTLPPDNGTTALAFSSLQVTMSEALNSISAKSPANYDLRRAGGDGLFDTVDDVIIALRPAYSYPETALTLDFLTGPGGTPGILSDGAYRLTLSGTKAIYDLSGNPLDGNSDGIGGDDYIRFFTIDRTTNAAPVANDQVRTVNEDGAVTITLSATDGNGDALTYTLISAPAQGVLSDFDPVARTVVYTPTPGYTGPDAFQFQVDDGKAGIDTGTVTLNVLPVNDAPLAAAQAVTLEEDTPRLIVLGGSDTETGRADLVFALVTGPVNGSLSFGPAGGWTYTPGADFVGNDSFTYTVTDRGDPDGTPANALTSAVAMVSLTVTAVNDAPVIAPVEDQVVLEGSTLLVNLSASDPEGQALVWSLDAAPAGMTIDANTGRITWTPDDGFANVDVSVRATDAGSPAAFDTVGFQVTVQNVAPTLTISGAAAVDQGAPFTLNLGATDPGADTIVSWEINWGDGFTQTVAGDVASVDHTYFAGGSNYSITATATDEDGTYASNSLGVFVTAPNTAPVPQSQTLFLDEDGSLVITLGASDANGDVLTFSIEAGPERGTLSAVDPFTRQVTFTPDANVRGNDSFTFRVSDGLASAVGTVNLKVRPVNDAPVANGAMLSVAEDTALLGQLTGSDVETPAELTFSLVSGPASGVLTLNPDGTFRYDPAADFAGTVSFVFTVTDGGDDELDCGCPLAPNGFVADGPKTSAPVTVTIDVTPVNDAPMAEDDAVTAVNGVALVIPASGVLGNDADVEGDALSVVGVGPAIHGTVSVAADGSIVYTADAGYIGSDTFTYTVSDGDLTDVGTVSVNVQPGTLKVTSLESTTSGFHVRFDRVIDANRLNLFDAADAGRGPSDLSFTGPTGAAVRGSVVMDDDGRGFTFVKTGTPLVAGAYGLRLRAGIGGLASLGGESLDGNGDGTGGDDYTGGFTVGTLPASALLMGDFARGPGQAVNMPLRLTAAGGVTSLSFDLLFDADSLAVTGVQFAGGRTGTIVTTAIAGGLRVDVTFDTPLPAGTVAPLTLTGSVPTDAVSTRIPGRLKWGDIVLERGVAAPSETVLGDEAVHAVGYFMDVNGDGAYTAADLNLLQRVITGKDSGFSAWRNLDPVVIGDLDGNGSLTSLDAARFAAFLAGAPRPEIPALPTPPLPPAPPAPAARLASVAVPPPAPGSVTRVDWDAPIATSAPTTSLVSETRASSWQADNWAKDLKQRLSQIPASQNLLRPLPATQKR